MNLAFATEELRTLCENRLAAERAFGMEVARQLRERLASIREAECMSELLTGQPTEIAEGTRRCYEIRPTEDYRMVVCANHKLLPLMKERDALGSVLGFVRFGCPLPHSDRIIAKLAIESSTA